MNLRTSGRYVVIDGDGVIRSYFGRDEHSDAKELAIKYNGVVYNEVIKHVPVVDYRLK